MYDAQRQFAIFCEAQAAYYVTLVMCQFWWVKRWGGGAVIMWQEMRRGRAGACCADEAQAACYVTLVMCQL